MGQASENTIWEGLLYVNKLRLMPLWIRGSSTSWNSWRSCSAGLGIHFICLLEACGVFRSEGVSAIFLILFKKYLAIGSALAA